MIGRVVVGLILLILGLVVAGGAISMTRAEESKLSDLRAAGIRSPATVVEITDRSRTGDTLAVRVRFTVGSGTATADVDISDAPEVGANVGDAFEVVYDPADPTRAMPFSIVSVSPWRSTLPALFAAGLAVILGMTVIGSAWWPRGRTSTRGDVS